jgi:hypothetical protein
METENKAPMTLEQERTALLDNLSTNSMLESSDAVSGTEKESPAAPELKEKEAPAKAESTEKQPEVSKSEAKAETKTEDLPEDLSDISDDKLKKDAERLAKSWKKHTEEKTEFRKKEAEYQAKLSDYESKLKQIEEREVNGKYSPDELRSWAKKWDEEGETEKAKAARQQANEIEDKAIRLRTERARQQEEFVNTWKATEKNLFIEYPDLAKEGSELRDKTADILSRGDNISRFIQSQPDGLKYAVGLANLRIQADLSSDLQKENSGLKNKIIELEKKLAPSTSVASKTKSDKKFDEMSLDEQRDELKRQLVDSWA